MTLSAVMTPMTEKTPIVTPRIVRTERSLFVFKARSAIRMVSIGLMAPRRRQMADGGWQMAPPPTTVSAIRHLPSAICMALSTFLFITKGLDGVQARCGQRGCESGEDAGHSGDDQSRDHETE